MQTRTTALLAMLAMLGAGTGAQAQLQSDVYTSSAAGTVVKAQRAGIGSAVVVRNVSEPDGGSRDTQLLGLAAAATQTLRAAATLEIDSTVSGNWASAKSYASFTKTLYLDPLRLGLPVDTPYSVIVPLRFDGLATTGGDTLGGSSFTYTSADVSLSYRAFDIDPILGQRQRVMSFGYNLRAIYDSREAPIGSASVSASWGGWSNATAYREGGIVDLYLDTTARSGSISQPVDTGLQLFTIDSKVGHQLRIEAWLDVFLQVEANTARGMAAGMYHNTFDAELLGTTPGASFDGEIAGVSAPVPEPAGVALWLAGLVALGLRGQAGRRRRTAV